MQNNRGLNIEEKTNEKMIEIIEPNKKKERVKLYLIRIVLVIMLLETFYLIFEFSNQNGEESTGVSKKVTGGILSFSRKNKTKEQRKKQIDHVEPKIRKAAHFIIYSIVGVLLMALMCTYNINKKDKYIYCLIIGFLYACSDEIHQLFVNERSGQFIDVLIDTSGVLLGAIIIYNMIFSLQSETQID